MSNVNLILPIITAAEDLYKAMSDFSKIAQKALYNSDEAVEYSISRGLKQESAIKYGIGYVPSDVNAFIRPLEMKIKKDLLKLGVIFDHGMQMGSILNSRIVFPIYDVKGRIISFSGRALSGITTDNPKYINTRNSQIFKKSLAIFGFVQALEHIISQRYCIVVEGNMDVVSLWQAGIKNVVAPCGTALTFQQLTILKRICNEIVLWFDDDEAGQKALKKSYPIATELGFKVGCMPAQQWKDPDEVLKNRSVDEILIDISSSFDYIPG